MRLTRREFPATTAMDRFASRVLRTVHPAIIIFALSPLLPAAVALSLLWWVS